MSDNTKKKDKTVKLVVNEEDKKRLVKELIDHNKSVGKQNQHVG